MRDTLDDAPKTEEKAPTAPAGSLPVQPRGLWELLLITLLGGVRSDEKAAWKDSLRAALSRRIPRRRALGLALAGALHTLLAVQVLTGMYAASVYRPTVADAWTSLRAFEQVGSGWFARQCHLWSGRVLIVLLLVMLARFLAVATHRRRGKMKWAAGFLLLPTLWAFFATGALLPMGASAQGATRTLAEALGAVPLLGPLLEAFLAHPAAGSAGSLSRSFLAHAVVLPWVLFILLLVRFSVVTRQGTREDPDEAAGGAPLWPDRCLDVLAFSLAMVGLVAALALFFPVDLGLAAVEGGAGPAAVDPVLRPFTALSVWMPSGWAGRVTVTVIPFVALLLLFFLPWLDRSRSLAPSDRRGVIMVAMAIVAGLVASMFLGGGMVG